MVAPSGKVRVRVVALVVRDNAVLVIEQTAGNETWNCFPGGTLEHGETIDVCLTRELREELSLEVQLGPLVACGTYEEDNITSLELYFQCSDAGDEPVINETHINFARYIPIKDLAETRVYPLELAEKLELLLMTPEGRDRGGVYFGRFC